MPFRLDGWGKKNREMKCKIQQKQKTAKFLRNTKK